MIEQLPWDPATEHFVPHATISQPVGFFALNRLIAFADGIDGLDYYRGALLLKDGKTRFLLKQYRGGNSSHTSIYLEPGAYLFDMSPEALSEITRTVEGIVADPGLAAHDIFWQRKDTPGA